jgi:hypothetical protein
VGGKEKKSSQIKSTWVEERKEKGQLEFTTLANPRTRKDEKGAPISAPSIHVPYERINPRDKKKPKVIPHLVKVSFIILDFFTSS